VSTDADHHQPFRLLDAGLIGLRIAQLADIDGARGLDFSGGAMPDKDRLATPIAEMSTSVEDKASTSAAGFMLCTNGHRERPAPTTPTAVVAYNRKSRRVSPSAAPGALFAV
jgi:hypothetical protein